MAIYKKIDGQDSKIAEKSIIDHSQLSGRNAYGAHSIQAIRGLPEKLTANKRDIEKEKEERIAAIIAEAEARQLADSAIETKAGGISLREGDNGTLVFTDYNKHETVVQGGYLPDDETIELQKFDITYKQVQLTEEDFEPNKYYILVDNEYVLADTYDGEETYYTQEYEEKLVAVALQTEQGNLSGNSINKELSNLKSVVNAKGGYLDSYDFNKADPTQEELTQYAIQDIGDNAYFELGELTQEEFNSYNYLYTFDNQTETYNRIYTYDNTPGLIYYTVNIWDKTRVINLYTNKTNHKNQDTWSWDYNSQTWSNLGNISLISDADNSGLHGLVTGAPNDGDHDYLGNIDDSTGYIHINGLQALADNVDVLTNKVNNQIINDKSLASNENAYSAQYSDNHFAPLSFVSRLYLEKVDINNAALVNSAPQIDPSNYLESNASIYPLDFNSSPLFTITRTLQADTTLNEDTSFTTMLNFITNRDCSLQFGARIKVSIDNGSTWNYISNGQSYGQEDYSQDALSTTQFIVYTDLLTSNTSYSTGTLLAIEVYACLSDGDSTTTNIRVACGIEKDNSNIYSYVQFNYQSVMIDTDQIEDNAITTSKIADGAVTRDKLSQEVKDELNSKVDKTTTIAGVDLQNNITKSELQTALTDSTHNFVTNSEINTWNAKQDAISVPQDDFCLNFINNTLSSTFTQEQKNAIDSGIDSNKVEQIATNTTEISNIKRLKQDNILEFTDTIVSSSMWESDSTYNSLGFTYKATISLNNVVDTMTPILTYSLEDSLSGDYSQIAETYDGGIYIWSKINVGITIPSILCVPQGDTDTTYQVYENEAGGLTYVITSSDYRYEINEAGGYTLIIGGENGSEQNNS